MRPTTPVYDFSHQARPSSPPETPKTSTFKFGKNSRSARRYGVQNFSRPLSAGKETIRPLGNGPHFNYNPTVRPEDLSPRSSSSLSSHSSHSPAQSLSSEPFSAPASDFKNEPSRYSRPFTMVHINSEGNFTIKEIRDSDDEFDDSDNEAMSVVLPDHYSDAESVSGAAPSPIVPTSDLDARLLADDLAQLDCSDERTMWKQKQRMERRKHRLSSGSIHKRTLSQSIGSDTDDEDLKPCLVEDANEAGSSARRLRRKVGDRTSLIFDDPPQRIIELDEPDSGEEDAAMRIGAPDVGADVVAVEEVLMHALPYYDEEDDTDSMMEVDSGQTDNSDSE